MPKRKSTAAREKPVSSVASFTGDDDVTRAIDDLGRRCKHMAAMIGEHGSPALRDAVPGLSGLVKIVVSQQVSSQSAAAIWSRVACALEPFDALSITARSDEDLQSLGLSRGKIRTIRAIAGDVASGRLDFATLDRMSDDDIVATLTAIHGLGPWSANVYLLFSLRRIDAFPAGDLALQLAAQHRLRLKAKPTPDELIKIAERWRPWRAMAARLLWADYGARLRGAAKAVKTAPARTQPSLSKTNKNSRRSRRRPQASQN
jgi:DNA-3-methyladenine glycosylase II